MSTATRPAARVPAVALAATVWIAVLALVLAVGVPRMSTWFGVPASAHRPTPLVGLALGEKPTYEWKGQGRGVVRLTYTATLTGGSSTPVTVVSGTRPGEGTFTPTGSERLRLHENRPVTRAVAVPVTCTTRTRIVLRSQAPGTTGAEVFTWVIPKKNAKGDPTCELI